jgi:hypothetical protein
MRIRENRIMATSAEIIDMFILESKSTRSTVLAWTRRLIDIGAARDESGLARLIGDIGNWCANYTDDKYAVHNKGVAVALCNQLGDILARV